MSDTRNKEGRFAATLTHAYGVSTYGGEKKEEETLENPTPRLEAIEQPVKPTTLVERIASFFRIGKERIRLDYSRKPQEPQTEEGKKAKERGEYGQKIPSATSYWNSDIVRVKAEQAREAARKHNRN
jgi:hypothetical protein